MTWMLAICNNRNPSKVYSKLSQRNGNGRPSPVRKAAYQRFSEELKELPNPYNQEDLVIHKLTRVSNSILPRSIMPEILRISFYVINITVDSFKHRFFRKYLA